MEMAQSSQWDEVISLFEAKFSDAEVAAKLGIRESKVRPLRRSFEERKKYETISKQIYPDEVGEWIQLQAGVRVNELSKKLNIKPQAIVSLLPRLGLVDKKTHSSTIKQEIATKVLSYFSVSGQGSEYSELSQVTIDFQRLLDELARSRAGLFALTPAQFEELIAEVWNRFGYSVELTARTRDGGYDVVAIARNAINLKFLIECKRYAPEHKINVGLVRALHGVKQHEGATKAVLATTSYFTDPAARFISQHRWELEGRDQNGVVQWINLAKGLQRNPGSVLWVPADS